MKKLMRLLLSIMLCAALSVGSALTAFAAPDWPSDTGVQSEAGIVMDMDSGAVLFGQNIHVQKAPASITKLLTALVVIENSNLDDMVTFSHDAVYNVEDGSGNKNAIEEGDVLSVRDCLYLLLLRSSNQAANALAEHVAGSRDGFVEMMNAKAEELGCGESHFANPSGLNDETQLTSVYDMALIGKAAYENPTLLEIGSTKSYRLPATINNPDGVTISMEHKLLMTTDETSPNYYPDAVAGKTGYTSIAGQTLVTYAVRDGRRLIAVTMKSTAATHYSDTVALLDFGFLRFKNLKIAEYETAYTSGDQPVELGGEMFEPSDLTMDENAVITVPTDATFADVVKTISTDFGEDAPVGAAALLTYTYNDRKIGETYLLSASRAAAEAAAASGENLVDSDADSSEETDPADSADEKKDSTFAVSGKVVATVTVVAVLAALVVLAVWFIKKKQEEERRLAEERRRKRRQRLEEIGCTQEEFDRLLEERNKRSKA